MVEQSVVERVLAAALRTGGEWAEVFVEDRRTSSASLDDGRVEEFTSGRDRGAGIRVVVGETTGFAHTADLTERGLLVAAEAAAAVAREGGGATRTVALTQSRPVPVNDVGVWPETVSKATKVELLTRADEAARGAGREIVQVQAGYSDSRRRILVANSDGLLAEDDQSRVRAGVMAVASGDTGMQTGYEVRAFTTGFELFDEVDMADVAAEAARRALVKLQAVPAPSGMMPVVIKNGTGGYIFHEACGHGLEADFVRKGTTVYTGRVGEQVAGPRVTFVDDATIAREWGSAAIDDEGRPAERTVLIDEGVLVDYMWDGLRARKEARPSTGNGRRQSYQHLPIPRMTNTFLVDGEDDPDEIIRSTERGLYVCQLSGGQVNTVNGDFVFGMVEAYLIENGEVTKPIREANLIGNGPEILHHIDAVGNDFAMSPGTCGKAGQSVPVGSGQPTMRITNITVGGTAGG